HLHCRGARLQAGLGGPQVQRKVRGLANPSIPASHRALARSPELGALAQHRLRQSEDCGMSKSYLRKNKIAGQFSARTIEMMESPAFQVLTLAEHRILARLETQPAHHGGNDNGRLPTTYDDLERYGVRRKSIRPSLRALSALGLIEITELGRAGNAEWRRSNKFRLTYRQVDRAIETDEWRRIKTMEQA